MKFSYPNRLPRRLLLSIPAVAAAAATIGLRPAQAKAQTTAPECAADLLGGS